MSRITYHRLSRTARDFIFFTAADPRGSIAAYVLHYFSDGEWRGDRCGCVDDRCIGYHHEEDWHCGCLPVWLDQMRKETQ